MHQNSIDNIKVKYAQIDQAFKGLLYEIETNSRRNGSVIDLLKFLEKILGRYSDQSKYMKDNGVVMLGFGITVDEMEELRERWLKSIYLSLNEE